MPSDAAAVATVFAIAVVVGLAPHGFPVCQRAFAIQGNNNNRTIRIGYFLQTSSPPYRIGAINLAIDRAKSDGLLSGFNFRYV